jgi:hypothetical protein
MITTLERRSFARETMSDMILFRRITGAQGLSPFRAGFLRDISRGGILFETDELLAEGDIVDLFFKERNAHADTHMRAEVVRTCEVGAGYEIGAKFLRQ